MIVETILTTLDSAGAVNIAPMGVEWGEESLIIKPFLDTQTFRNLATAKTGVVNLIDDVLLFAQAAIGHPTRPTAPAEHVQGVRLRDACSWREVRIADIDATPPRARIRALVVHHGFGREFIGFNRARHAVLEAAILATRTHLIPIHELAHEFTRLQVIVDKTAGAQEREAMTLLTAHVFPVSGDGSAIQGA